MTVNVENDELSLEQIDQLIAGKFEGDTGEKPEISAKPDGAKDKDVDELEGLTAENAAIQARDGKHLIGFEKLVEARESAQRYKQEAQEALAQLEALKQAAPEGKQNAQIDAAQAAIDAGVSPELFGDFSEQALAEGINKLVSERMERLLNERLATELEPIKAREAVSKQSEHERAILAAHPDAQSIAESVELENWINSQPSFLRNSYAAVLSEGSTQDVIELLNAYKANTNTGNRPAPVRGVQAPHSLSDFAGSARGASSRTEAMQNMDGLELVNEMANMTPEQLENYLNRL